MTTRMTSRDGVTEGEAVPVRVPQICVACRPQQGVGHMADSTGSGSSGCTEPEELQYFSFKDVEFSSHVMAWGKYGNLVMVSEYHLAWHLPVCLVLAWYCVTVNVM